MAGDLKSLLLLQARGKSLLLLPMSGGQHTSQREGAHSMGSKHIHGNEPTTP